jgi:hypothetical protein
MKPLWNGYCKTAESAMRTPQAKSGRALLVVRGGLMPFLFLIPCTLRSVGCPLRVSAFKSPGKRKRYVVRQPSFRHPKQLAGTADTPSPQRLTLRIVGVPGGNMRLLICTALCIVGSVSTLGPKLPQPIFLSDVAVPLPVAVPTGQR